MEPINFKLAKTYKGKNNDYHYVAVGVTDNNVTFRIKETGTIQTYKKVLYCGVYAAIFRGTPVVLSDNIKPVIDESIEIHPRIKSTKHIFTLNTNGETYVTIFEANHHQHG